MTKTHEVPISTARGASSTTADQGALNTRKHFPVLDFLRGLAIIHIFMYHYYLEWFHGSFLMVSEGFAKNMERLQIFQDGGVLGLIKNLFSFLFVYGFTSVNVFLILSGFVLASGSLSKGDGKGLGEKNIFVFYWKKIKRILIPLYFSVVVGIALLYLRNWLFPGLAGQPNFGAWDFLKIIFPPLLLFDVPLLQRFNGDYWYITIILQFYLIYPVLFWLLKKVGPIKFLTTIAIITLSYRFLATYGYQLLLPFFKFQFLDSAPMGVIYPTQNSYYGFSFFLPRLFEFGLGMTFAYWENLKGTFLKHVTKKLWFIAAIIITLIGFSLNYFHWGWIFSDPVTGLGLFLLFLNLAQLVIRFKWNLAQKFLKKLSDASFEIYLLHHYFLNYLFIPVILTLGLKNEWGFWLFIPIFFAVSVLTGLGQFYLTKLLSPVRLRSK